MEQRYYEASALAVANYFVDAQKQKKLEGIDLLKINKLVYIAYGFFYGLIQKYLYEDRIEAWRFGPVVPIIYHTFKHCAGNVIDSPGKDYDWENRNTFEPRINNKPNIERVLDFVIKMYKHETAGDLVRKTHGPNSPWTRVFKPGIKNIEIPKPIVEEYYGSALKEASLDFKKNLDE